MKNLKPIILVYLFIAVFAYALSVRANNLESKEDLKNHNESIVINIK